MKFILSNFLICLLIVTINSQRLTRSRGGVGAIYTMTNGASQNQVLVFRLNINGQLSWVNTVSTNGIGVQSTDADSLFSQGSMTIFSNYLFVVNAGSDSLSMFKINPLDATKLTLVSVQPTNGQFPTSVAVNSRYACVLTTGTQTGIRCFSYNSSGLFVIPLFDRDLTSYVSRSTPPSGAPGTFSEILFSADDRSLIISVKAPNTRSRGYLLFFQISNNGAILSSNPKIQSPANGIFPFSLTLVGSNGLLITDPGSAGVMTQSYSSRSGTITNSIFTPIDASIAGALCWSTYSPTVGNYYVVGLSPPAFVELKVDVTSTSTPVEIVRYYSLPSNTGGLDTTVVTLGGIDYLYVLGATSQVIYSYRLNASGNALLNQVVVTPQANIAGIPKITGIAAYVQTPSSSGRNFFS